MNPPQREQIRKNGHVIRNLNVLKEAAVISKGLVCDQVARAESGHLGTALGCSAIGAALFGQLLRFNPMEPRWINRDRFVLSCGHASAFLYAWLHLAGYDLSLDDLKNFRAAHSKTPGHPEFGLTDGVECTTGPLGQGVANAVGFAISGKKSEAMFNTVKWKIFDYRVVCLCGDGCLQEGVASEACSLAGHLKLDNLILIYDRNNVTIDGDLSRSQSENIEKRFEAYGFEIKVVNGNEMESIIASYSELATSKSKLPKLLIANTIIGDGVGEVAGTNRAHGEAGVRFVKSTKAKLGLPDVNFYVSDRVKNFFSNRLARQLDEYNSWLCTFENWAQNNSTLHKILLKDYNFHNQLESFEYKSRGKVSTRIANGEIMQFLAKHDPLIVTGSADLFSSTKNYLDAHSDFSAADRTGKNIEFGAREHAMGAIANGVCYDGVFNVSCATFLVFSDYMRAAIRIASMANLHVIYIFTHDSVAVGKDGPTHQPIETLASLQCIPNLCVIRPADCEELIGAWIAYYSNKNFPFAFILSRQDLPNLRANGTKRSGVLCGAYIVHMEKSALRCIVIATGSEVSLAIEAARNFDDVRVVSMPCMKFFDEQDVDFRESILPTACENRVAIEAGITMPWYKYAGPKGKYMGINKFGFSGSEDDLYVANGLTVDSLIGEISSFF
ncbi:MAG: transketolase [Puniceicoccales bacterium]|jgi:transketolase|nr:transketolase [Puniceicoccales bacterium]